MFDHGDVPPEGPFARLVTLDARNRMSKGDLAGSWDDIVVLLRMARHFSEGSGGGPATRVLTSVERDALGLAMKWVIRARTRRRSVSMPPPAAYREMPKVPSAADIPRGRSQHRREHIRPPREQVSAMGCKLLLDSGKAGLPAERPWAQTAFSYWTLTPWERNRGRRVNRMFSRSTRSRHASTEPGQRPDLNMGCG